MEKICQYPPCRKKFETNRAIQNYCCLQHQQNARAMRYRAAHPNLNPKKQGRPPLSETQKAIRRFKREVTWMFNRGFSVLTIFKHVKEVHDELGLFRP